MSDFNTSSQSSSGVAIPPLTVMQGAKPLWASTSTITIANFTCGDSTNTLLIQNTSPATLTLSASGVNGVAQSAALTGTVGTGGSASTTITGSGTSFSSVFQVGDVLYTASGAARITAIGSNTSLTVSTALTLANGTAFKRGGLAINTYYYLYAISTGTTPGYVLSTRNTANGSDVLADLPSGYSYFRQLRFFVQTDASANLKQFVVQEGWPLSPFIQLTPEVQIFGGTLPPGVWNNMSAAVVVPPICRQVMFSILETLSCAIFLTTPSLYPNILQTFNFGYSSPPGSPGGTANIVTPLDADQRWTWYQNGTSAMFFSVAGVYITEVNN